MTMMNDMGNERKGKMTHYGDNGDGTYQTIILPADYSDADPIRVGEDYYMVVSSFMDACGVPVLHSGDLVNWETISYAVPDTTELSEEFSWERMGGYGPDYGHGVYACTIRFHEGKFYVFIPVYPDGGIFVSKADRPEGPWKLEKITDKNGKHVQYEGCRITDICPFWDEDGKQYLILSHLSGNSPYDIDGVGMEKMGHPAYIYEMNAEGNRLTACDSSNEESMRNTGVLVRNTINTEGNKIYKKNGWYYIFNVDFLGRSFCGPGAYIKRSRFLFGSKDAEHQNMVYTDYKQTHHAGYYEMRFLGNDTCIPTQGGFVATPDGKWFFIGQKNEGTPGGRMARLVPVAWKDDWPVIGVDSDGDGAADQPFLSGKKPVDVRKRVKVQGSDDFADGKLSINWQWNHQPRDGYWSVTERDGYLRLKAFRTADGTHDFWKAGNTIHQRFLDVGMVVITVKMDISGMEDGQEAGIAHFNGGTSYGTFGIVREGKNRRFLITINGDATEGVLLPAAADTVWLRTQVTDHLADFSFSCDGVHYRRIDQEYEICWGSYRGDRTGIYTFNNLEDKGFIDVDYFDHCFSE